MPMPRLSLLSQAQNRVSTRSKRRFMCRPHWRLVPGDLRADMLNAFQLARTARQQRGVAAYAVAFAVSHLTGAQRRLKRP